MPELNQMLVKMQDFYMGKDNIDTFLQAEKISKWVLEKCLLYGGLEGSHTQDNFRMFLRTRHIIMDKKDIQQLHCSRCGYCWYSRKPTPPKHCPDCNSPYWSKARTRKVKISL
jgi:rubrerythrin